MTRTFPQPGCSCGMGQHEARSHLWSKADVAHACRMTVRALDRYLADPACPLRDLSGSPADAGKARRWSYEDVLAHLAWMARPAARATRKAASA